MLIDMKVKQKSGSTFESMIVLHSGTIKGLDCIATFMLISGSFLHHKTYSVAFL